MPGREATIRLAERDIQDVEQAVLDADEASALDFLRRVLKPKVDEAICRPRCKPAFEWGGGEGPRLQGVPDRP
jgi:hypothetical protein